MEKIFKYPLEVTDTQFIEVPKGAAILTVQAQKDIPCIWAQVDPDMPLIKRRILTYGTGHPIDPTEAKHYIGTYQINGGHLVFHVFTDRVEYPIS